MDIPESRDVIFKRLCDNQKLFGQKLMLGACIHQILLDYYFDPTSLSKSDREALELYEKINKLQPRYHTHPPVLSPQIPKKTKSQN